DERNLWLDDPEMKRRLFSDGDAKLIDACAAIVGVIRSALNQLDLLPEIARHGSGIVRSRSRKVQQLARNRSVRGSLEDQRHGIDVLAHVLCEHLHASRKARDSEIELTAKICALGGNESGETITSWNDNVLAGLGIIAGD